MKCLCRFEDYYGMLDIVCAVRNVPRSAVSDDCEVSLSEHEDAKGNFGITKVFGVNKNTAENYKRAGIERVIFVYDVDSMHHTNDILLSMDQFLYGSNNRNAGKFAALDATRNLQNLGIDVRFIPVVYCAETIVLFQFSKLGLDVADMMHADDTPKLILSVLTTCYKHSIGFTKDARKECKKINEYLRIDEVLKRLRTLDYSKSVNKELYNWMLSGCKFDEENCNLFDLNQAIAHLQKVTSDFDLLKSCGGTQSINILNKDVTLSGIDVSTIYKTLDSLVKMDTL